MLHQKRFMTTLALLTIASLIITACAQAAPTPQGNVKDPDRRRPPAGGHRHRHP